MDLSVIIVNWKVRDLLDKCLASLYRETRGITFEVLVVDNDSRDGSIEMVAAKYPQVQLTASNRNLGFAAGNNLAIAAAKGDFIILLNPDTEFIEDALTKLVAFMRRKPSAGIAGPTLLNPDRSLQPSVRRFPDLWSQIALMLKLQAVWPNAPWFHRRQAADFDYTKEQPCDQVMGAAFIIRRSVLEAIGALDERYWIWFEEVDYCRMSVRAGFQTWYTPSARLIHHGGESFGQVFGPVKQGYFDRSARAYFRKHHGVGTWLILMAVRPASMALSWLAVLPKRFGWRGIKV